VNYLIDPAHLEELEAFNNIWLEAFGYHLGHAGRLSEKVTALVRGYEQGEKEARRNIKEILKEVYHNLKRKLKLRRPKTWLVGCGLNCLVEKIPWEKESGLFGVSIDEKLKRNIAGYLDKYIVQRYRQGKAKEYHFHHDADIPTPLTFVYGHTHRPIREKERADAKIVLQGKTYPLGNTGGWLRTDGTGAANGGKCRRFGDRSNWGALGDIGGEVEMTPRDMSIFSNREDDNSFHRLRAGET